MEQTTTPSNGPTLQRPLEGRSVAGVAVGVANYFNLPVGLVRAALVISVFFGGLGLAAYAAGWVAIREEASDESLIEKWLANFSSPSSWVGLGIVVLALVVLFGNIRSFSGSTMVAALLVVGGILLYRGVFDDNTPTGPGASVDAPRGNTSPDDNAGASDSDVQAAMDEIDAEIERPMGFVPGPDSTRIHTAVIPRRQRSARSKLGRFTLAALLITVGSMAVADTADLVELGATEYFAAALMVVGAGLAVGALFGRAYGLIALGLVFVVAVQVTTWFDVPLSGGFGDPIFAPASASEVEDEYRLLAGQMTVSLADLTEPGEVRTDIALGAGELIVRVPDDANVIVDLRVVAGELLTPDSVRSGTDIDGHFERRPDGADTTIFIDASVGLGQLNLVLDR